MAEGYKTWTPGEIPTADDIQDYLQHQTVMRFASAAARNSATAPTEGYCSILQDVNTMGIATGSAWSTIGPVHGALTSYTPTLVQSGAVSKTTTRAVYSRVGRQVTVQFNLNASGAGSATFPVLVGAPVTAFAAAGATDVVGVGYIRDASAGIKYRAHLVFLDTAQVQFLTLHSTTDGYLGNVDFTAALASGDQISGCFQYEAAADA